MATYSEYVDLLSTASLDLHPENRGCLFTNQLPNAQLLPPNTYVGLEGISYINTFYNVKKKYASLTIFDMLKEYPPHSARNSHDYPIYGKFYPIHLKEGIYHTITELCKMLNECLRESLCPYFSEKKEPTFTYNPVTMRFSYDLEGFWGSIWFRGDLLNLMGIETKQSNMNEYVIIGKSKNSDTYEYPRSLLTPRKKEVEKTEMVTRHFAVAAMWTADSSEEKGTFEYIAQLKVVNSMVLYTNIIDSQITGDVYSQVLRIVPIKASNPVGASIVTHFTKPYYMKCNRRYISSITIEIKDLAGREIEFLQGIVRVKLRFTTAPSLTQE